MELGQKLNQHEHRRDAVHVAMAPCTAMERMLPGDHVKLVKGEVDKVVGAKVGTGIGIIDPFLTEHVNEGDRVFVCLYPNTVTGMRHVWKHPEFNR